MRAHSSACSYFLDGRCTCGLNTSSHGIDWSVPETARSEITALKQRVAALEEIVRRLMALDENQ